MEELKEFDIKQFAEKFGGKIEISIFECTLKMAMDIKEGLDIGTGEYWSGNGSCGVRFKKGNIDISCYFKTENIIEEKEEK